MWIVRDKNKDLYVYFTKEKPVRMPRHGEWGTLSETEITGGRKRKYAIIPFDMFPNITWDSEPFEIKEE